MMKRQRVRLVSALGLLTRKPTSKAGLISLSTLLGVYGLPDEEQEQDFGQWLSKCADRETCFVLVDHYDGGIKFLGWYVQVSSAEQRATAMTRHLAFKQLDSLMALGAEWLWKTDPMWNEINKVAASEGWF